VLRRLPRAPGPVVCAARSPAGTDKWAVGGPTSNKTPTGNGNAGFGDSGLLSSGDSRTKVNR
jgi:hypothetical protein